MTGTKRCCTCGEEKPHSEFHKNKSKEDGLHLSCKVCRKAESKRYLTKNEEVVYERQRERYHQDRNKYLAMMTRYRTANKEVLRQKQAEWRDQNREAKRERDRLYSKNNVEKLQQYRQRTKAHRSAMFKQYAQNNRGRLRAIRAKRYTSKMNATPKWLTKEDFDLIRVEYELSAWCSDVMGEKYHVDHIVPLQGKKVCGLHVPWNLRVIPATENIRKGNKYDQSVWEPQRSS